MDIDALLELEDEKFVRAAYAALLDRAPDPEGLGSYLEQLRSGTSKVELLASLALSAEGRARSRGDPGASAAVLRARERHRMARAPQARTLEELMAFHDEAFVRAAYRAVLGREADAEGLASYLPVVRAGTPKARILGWLCASPEAAARAEALRSDATPAGREERALRSAIDGAVLRDRLARIPLAGRWIAPLVGAERDDGMHARLRSIENALHRIGAVPPDAAGGDAPRAAPQPAEDGPDTAPATQALLRPAASAAALLATLPTAVER